MPSHIAPVLGRSGCDTFIVGTLVLWSFLALVLLSGLFTVEQATRAETAGAAVVTVQLPAGSVSAEQSAAVEAIAQAPGVASAEHITEDAVAALLAPWFESHDLLEDLPLPILIDVRAEPGADVDWPDIAVRLQAAAPGAVLDVGSAADKTKADLAGTARRTGITGLVVWSLVTILLLVFAIGNSLSARRPALVLIHRLGALDRDVAAAFQRRVLVLSLWGVVGGVLAALAVAAFLAYGEKQLAAPWLAGLTTLPTYWVLAAALPLGGMALAVLMARIAALRALARMF